MKLFVSTKPGAKENRVEAVDATHFRVWVKAAPQDGKANEAVIAVLSAHFHRPKSCFEMAAGHKIKNKTVSFEP